MAFGFGSFGSPRGSFGTGGVFRDPEETRRIVTMLADQPEIAGILRDPSLVNILRERFRPGGGIIVDPFFPRPEAPRPPAPSGTPADVNTGLQILLSALPIVADGDVIRSEHHNALRAAILMLAQQMGIDIAGGSLVMSFAPTFSPTDASKPPWQSALGVATKSVAAGTAVPATEAASGWMPVELPDAARIDRMTVVGRRVGGVKDLTVKLLRHALGDGQGQFERVELIALSAAVGDPFTSTKSLQIPRLSLDTIEELRRVNNAQFKYLVTADLFLADATGIGQINAIQIVCSK